MRRLLFSVLILSEISFAQSDFKQFKQYMYKGVEEEKGQFYQYKKSIEEEFLEYKKVILQEYENYKKEILKYWDEAELPTNKKFVEYSKDFKVKKVVDFEKGEIKIEVISKEKPSKRDFENLLYSLAVETKKEAFEKDRLSQNIEKKLKNFKNVKFSSVDNSPLVADLITGKEKPSKEDVKKSTVSLLKSAEFKVKPLKSQKGKSVFSIKIKLPPKRILIKAKRYKPVVEDFAEKYQLSTSVLLAVIHTESAFNPLARSYVPAYGLMQIVPQTAGKDATKFLYGKPMLLSPSYLYNDKNNILIGSTYFYILYYRYLKDIKDPISRLYCAIAAYNTGAGNVARAFTGTRNIKKAVRVINRMSRSEVYDTLIHKLPYQETRHYLKKVVNRMRIYQNI